MQMAEQLVNVRAWQDLFEKLDACLGLAPGWDGYSASPPSSLAVERAKEFLTLLRGSELEPARLKPSVASGIGLTIRKGRRKVYVEFYNDGTVYALFSDGESEPETRQVQARQEDHLALIGQSREYLNA
jgi:hypothetical protein